MRYIGLILILTLICSYKISEAYDPIVNHIELFEDDNGGTTISTSTMTPNNEMTLVVTISDDDGFNDIYAVNFYIWDSKTATETDTPSDRATYQWDKTVGWRLIGPLNSTWTIDKTNCAISTITTSTGILKLVFTPGKISRQSPDWKIRVKVWSTTQDAEGLSEIAISNAYYSEINIDNKDISFDPNFAGITANSATYPINLNVISNGTYTIQIKADDFIGERGTISLGLLGYALTNTVTSQTTINTAYQPIGTYSITSEEGVTKSIYLWLDYPLVQSGTYNSQLYLTTGIESTITLKAFIKKPTLGSLILTAPSINTAGENTLFCLKRLTDLFYPMIEGTTTISLSSTSLGSYTFKTAEGIGMTTLIIPDGTNSVEFYYADEKAGDWIIETRVGTISTCKFITIIPGEINQLILLTAPQSAVASSPSDIFRLQRQDKFSNPITQGTTVINLSSKPSHSTWEFRKTPYGSNITNVTIDDGTSTTNFYYYDEVPGTWTLTFFKLLPYIKTTTLISIIENFPQLEEIANSIFPDSITQGEKNIGFQISIKNLSSIDVTLGTQSCLFINGVTSTLIAKTKVLGNADANLKFSPVDINLSPDTYFVTLSLKGDSYSKTLLGANKVKISPPYVTLTAENLPTEIKYPGQTNLEILKIKAENSYFATKTITTLKLTGTATQSITKIYLYYNGLSYNTTFISGTATFDNLNIVIPPNYGTTTFLITYDLSLKNAKDGDIIDVQLQDVTFATDTTINANLPLNSYGYHIIDGMISSQILINHILPSNFKSGDVNKTVLDITISSNGYATDTLKSFSIENAGSANENDMLLKLWVGSICLGTMNWTGAMWQKTGLDQPIGTAGLKLRISVDITDTAYEGKTIKMRIPIGGIEVVSNNDGPIDNYIENYYSQRIKVHNKVIFEALDLLKEKVHPNDKQLDILSLAITNYYTKETHTLISLIITNTNKGTGSLSQLDSQVDTLYLYENTTLIGISHYKDGKAIFSGLNIAIPPEKTKELKVKYDVSLTNAKDDNILDCLIVDVTDINFESGTTSLGGIFPLDSFGFHKIDGLVNAQITNYGAKSTTIATDTTNVLVLDVFIPSNGYAEDTLTKIRIKNSGTAKDQRDIKRIKLNTDTFSWQQEYWEWSGTMSIPYPGKRVQIMVDVTDEPINGSTMMMKIPVNGLEFLSNNDGPIDSEIINPYVQTISKGLLSSIRLLSAKVEIGGTITVIMSVKNASTEEVHTVTPTTLVLEGLGSATLISAPTGIIKLPAGSSTEFIWLYKASNYPGTLTFNGSVTSSIFSSINTYSELLYIQDIPKKLQVSHIPSMPFEVNKGQQDIIPMSFIFKHPATSTFTGDIFIGTLSFDVGTIPNRAIAKITLMQSGIILGSKTNIESSGTIIILPLTKSIVIPSNQSVIVQLIIEISTSTTTDKFRMSLIEILAKDKNSYQNVTIEGLPLISDYTWIKTPSAGIKVGLKSDNVSQYVNKGQNNVLAGQIEIMNKGSNTSKVELTKLSITINATNTISKITIKDDTTTYAEKNISSEQLINFDLFTPIIIYNFKKIDIRLNIVDNSATSTFYIGSLSVTVRDYNTKQNLPVEFGTTSSFPITIQDRAQGAIVTATSTLPIKIYRGQKGIEALKLTINNPNSTNSASILLKEVTLYIPTGVNKIIIGDDSYTVTGTQNLTLITPTIVTPQSTVTLKVKIDISPIAELGETKLGLVDLILVDANDFSTISDTFSSIITLSEIMEQPTGLLVSYQNYIPVNVGQGDKNIQVLSLTFTNHGGTYTDEIKIGTISLSITDRFNTSIIPSSVLSKLTLFYDGTQTSKTNIETNGSKVTLSNLKISVSKSKTLIVKIDISDTTTSSNFKIGLQSNTDIEAKDALDNSVTVSALSNYSFPMWSESTTIFEPVLENSFTNYPNPFAAGRESTTITYYLPQDGYVTIKIYTVTGDLVRTLVDNNFKARGMQEEKWDGRNGVGEIVLNGVYFCQIKANYMSGTSAQKVRKIAVVR